MAFTHCHTKPHLTLHHLRPELRCEQLLMSYFESESEYIMWKLSSRLIMTDDSIEVKFGKLPDDVPFLLIDELGQGIHIYFRDNSFARLSNEAVEKRINKAELKREMEQRWEELCSPKQA